MMNFNEVSKRESYYNRSRKHYTDMLESEKINLQYYLSTFDGHVLFSRHSTKRLKERTGETIFNKSDIKLALKHNNILEVSHYNSIEENGNKLRLLIENRNFKNNKKLFIVIVLEKEVLTVVSTWLERSGKKYAKLSESDLNLNVTGLLEEIL